MKVILEHEAIEWTGRVQPIRQKFDDDCRIRTKVNESGTISHHLVLPNGKEEMLQDGMIIIEWSHKCFGFIGRGEPDAVNIHK